MNGEDSPSVINLENRKKSVRVPSSKRTTICPRCNEEFDVYAEDRYKLMALESEEIAQWKRVQVLEDALRDIYSRNGEDEYIANLMIGLEL